MRIPWPWEGPEPVLASGDPVSASARALLERVQPDTAPAVISGGEPVMRASVRDTRARLYRDALDLTDGSDAAREWAATKADRAISTWARGIADGSITLQR